MVALSPAYTWARMRLLPARTILAGSTALVLALLFGCEDDGGFHPPRRTRVPPDASPPPVEPPPPLDDGGTPPPPEPPKTCGRPLPPKTGYLGSQSLVVGGVTRTFALTLPKAYDGLTTYPVVLAFHGDGGDGAGLRSELSIEAASADGAIFVYPDGLGKTWSIDKLPAGATLRDIAVVDAILAHLASTYCVDTKKVFLTGFSRGAYFVNQFACRTKSLVRGIVTLSGGGPFGIADSEFDHLGRLVCPSAPVPAMQVQGAADAVVAPSEGQKARDHWRAANACSEATSATDPSPCVAYDGCARPEVWCLVPGLGHTIWQSASEATWAFFASL